MDQCETYSPAPSRVGVLKAVAAAYGLTINSTPPLRLGGATNYVLRVSTHCRDVVIRVHRPEATPDRLMAVHRIQEHLRAEGLPIPAILRTRDGDSWFSVDGHLVEVLDYVPDGHEVATWQAGAAIFSELGRLHAGVRMLDVRDLPPPVNACYATPETGLSLLETTDVAFRSQVDRVGYPQAAATRASTAALLRELHVARRAYGDELQSVLSHGDFVGNNVLLVEERVVAILDFDRLAVRERIHEIARTLMYVLSRVVYPRYRDLATNKSLSDRDLGAMAQLIVNYTLASGWQVTSPEFLALPFEMAGAPLYPIVTAGADPLQAVAETLIFAPHVSMAQWLTEHASYVSGILQERAEETSRGATR